MSKVKTAYFCSNCGAQSAKWNGQCTSCGAWNTIAEEVVQKISQKSFSTITNARSSKPELLSSIASDQNFRIDIRNQELNRVLGGGLVPGSLILLGGEPGIGKSTLLLQVALQLPNISILYISGEESSQQIKIRADRIGSINDNLYILTETVVQNIALHIEELKPGIIIVDSIQTLTTQNIESSAGSVSQIRETTNELQQIAKSTGIPIFLVGHITKDGTIAGPKLLEHMVDTVLQFEGDRNYGYRIVRSVKNRFGSTSELGIYEMTSAGLREVSNPSEILISQRDDSISGVAIAATIEGLRPLLIETQALVSSAVYGTPQRSATGFDLRRLNMLLAVLEKRCGFKLGTKDVFLNIAGGIRVDDPANDLSIIAAILSSGEDIAIDSKDCFAAEVGLSGEIRPVVRVDQRIAEAEKMGFKRIFISRYNVKGLEQDKLKIKIIALGKIEDMIPILFG
ncbi:MAG: DNA repair protein RadA [Bacteroidota bacterium]|jgi:DNA repair protein RadA/Sms